MKRGLVIGGGVLGAIVVVIVGVFVFVLSNLDSLVKEAVEKVGSDATQARVTLNEVKISLKSGAGALNGLTVGNPKGFKTPSAFRLGGISVAIDTGSVGSDPVIIKEVVITKPQVTYELAGGGSNVDAIQNNVDAYSKRFASGEKKSGEGPKLVIENLYVRGGEIGVSAPFLAGKTLSTPLPDIHLKDIGKKEKGADPAQVVKEVIASMSKGVGAAVSGLGLDEMMKSAGAAATKAMEGAGKALEGATGAATGAASGAAEGAGKALEGAGDAASKAVGGAVEGAGKALEDATGGIKKLFGK